MRAQASAQAGSEVVTRRKRIHGMYCRYTAGAADTADTVVEHHRRQQHQRQHRSKNKDKDKDKDKEEANVCYKDWSRLEQLDVRWQ